MALDREQIGEQTARQHDDESGVSQMNAEFAPGPAKTFPVRSDQINQQHRTDEMPAGKNRNFEAATFRRPPNEQALEIALLRFVNAEMDLRERAGEDEHHGRDEADDRQLQRGDQVDKISHHVFKLGRPKQTSRTPGKSKVRRPAAILPKRATPIMLKGGAKPR